MTDKKITELTEDSSPAQGNLLVEVDLYGVNKKVSVYNIGKLILNAAFRVRAVEVWAVEAATDCSIADGLNYFRIPSIIDGYNLTGAWATCITAGVTGTMTVQLRNVTLGADMLTTLISIDSGDTDSLTAAVQPVIDPGYQQVFDGNIIAIDVDAIHTTPAKGLLITMEFTPVG
jgi:hypothetical protein